MARGPTVRPITPRLLVAELAERAERVLAAAPAGWVRIAVDGAPAAQPGALADELADALRKRGCAVLRVTAGDFLRPASVRLERGRQDPDAYYDEWLDEQALRREVLRPLDRDGTGTVLPRLWNTATDRSYRAERVTLPAPGVLLLDGALLLGRGLPLELTAHLALSDAALNRRTPPEQRWTLPAFDRYRREVDPERTADVVVCWDHPSRPAIRTAAAG